MQPNTARLPLISQYPDWAYDAIHALPPEKEETVDSHLYELTKAEQEVCDRATD